MDPVSLGLMAGGGLLGFLGGKSREAEARRIEKLNAEKAANDSMFHSTVGTRSTQQAVPDAGPGAFGGALGGALSGFNQYQALQGMGADNKSGGEYGNLYQDLMKKKQPPMAINTTGFDPSRMIT